MFVQLLCKDRNQKEKDELYQVLAALAHREQLQIEERGDIVELDVCPQGKIQVSEEGRQVIMSANTRHGGPGFHAFCVDLFLDIQHELPGDYELIDDLELDKDGNFHRIFHLLFLSRISFRTTFMIQLFSYRWKKKMRSRHP